MGETLKNELYDAVMEAYNTEQVLMRVSDVLGQFVSDLSKYSRLRFGENFSDILTPRDRVITDCTKMEVWLYVLKRMLDINEEVEDDIDFHMRLERNTARRISKKRDDDLRE